MDKQRVHVLLIEDDPDDHLLTKELLAEIPGKTITLDWAPNYRAGLEALQRGEHDAVLVDYRLGKEDGLALLREALSLGYKAPMILLTGQGDRALAMDSLKAGAADYLVKSELNAVVLERSIRYALVHQHNALELERKVAERTTEMERANAAQRESEEYLRLLLDSTDQGFYAVDQNSLTTTCNAAFLRLLGFKKTEDVVGKKLHALIHHSRPDGTPYAVEDCPIYKAAREGKPAHVTDELFFPITGEPFPVEYRSHPVYRDGELRGAITTFVDITERKRTEMSLRLAETQLQSAIDAGAVGTWNWDVPSDSIISNPVLAHMFALEPEEARRGLPSESYLAAILADDRSKVEAALQEALDVTGHYRIEYRVRNTDGEIRSVIARGEVERDPAGKALRLAGAVTDITERRAAEERFQFLAESMPQKIFTATPEGEPDYFNREWTEFTGLTMKELRERGWAQFVHSLDVVEHLRRWEKSVSKQAPFTMEHRLLGADGHERWHLSRAFPMRDGEGKVTMWIGSNTDIDDQKRNEEALRGSEARSRALYENAEAARVSAEAAKGRAEAATRAKDDFLAALSHELRTPLNPALLLATSMAGDADLPDRVRRDIDVIAKGIALQAELVDDLLDITRITGGKLRLELRPIDAHAALRNAYEIVRGEAEGMELKVHFDLAAERACVHADPVRMQQVFWNVLKNAVKFTPRGGSISIQSSNPANEPDAFVVEVTDSGIGIAPEMLGNVFNAFVQEEHDRGHRFGGIGLGLAITRRLVDLQHGQIQAMSGGRGHGSTFRIQIPVETEEACSEADTILSQPISDRTLARRILLVEDHEETRTTLSQLLTRRGHSVVAASTVAAARAQAQENAFDLVISDLGLPDGDGHELMAQLHSVYRLPGIALSGYGMDEDIARSGKSGFFTHLTKPVDIRNLETAIATAPLPAAT